MEIPKRAIENVLFMKDNICCLCFHETDSSYHLSDEVYTMLNSYQNCVPITQILNSLFESQMVQKLLSNFSKICSECVSHVIKSYTFIENVKDNIENFSRALDNFSLCLHSIDNETIKYKTLYATLNKDYTTNLICDDAENIKTPKEAMKRLQSIIKNEIKHEIQIKKEIVVRNKDSKRKRNSKTHIKTVDMMLDKNDHSNLKCKVCLSAYSNRSQLRSHYIRIHAPKIFKCSICNRAYGAQGLLDAHKTESHGGPLMCSECGKTFYNRHTLREHERNHYLSFVCPDCGRSYSNRSTFKNHIELNICGQATRASPSNAKFTCDYCNKKYTQKMSLRVHIQYEHLNYKAHVCKWCNKKFYAKSRLDTHIVTHTKEKKFKCDQCGGNFVTKESLLYHTRIHTGERPYACDYCNQSFLSASRRSIHVKQYHTEAKYECEVCGVKFKTRTYLQRHRKIHTETVNLNPIDDEENAVNVKPPKLKKESVEFYSNHIDKDKVYLDLSEEEDYVITIEEKSTEFI